MSRTAVAEMSPHDHYCKQLGRDLHWCDQLGSCVQEKVFAKKCPGPPYHTGQGGPSLGACLGDSLAFCSRFSMPEEVRSCQNGALYSNLAKTTLSDETVRSMTLFSGAFLAGMQRAKGCHEGVMPYY